MNIPQLMSSASTQNNSGVAPKFKIGDEVYVSSVPDSSYNHCLNTVGTIVQIDYNANAYADNLPAYKINITCGDNSLADTWVVEKYLSLTTEKKVVCTCSIEQIMANGCSCGAIMRYTPSNSWI